MQRNPLLEDWSAPDQTPPFDAIEIDRSGARPDRSVDEGAGVTVAGGVGSEITHDEKTLAEGAKVRIVAMEGTRVVIEPIDTAGPDTNETGGARP